MNAFEQIKAALAGLTEPELDAVEREVRFARARRLGPGTQDAIGQEVDRLIAGEEARRAAAREEWDAHYLRVLRSRLERFQKGRLVGMCDCRDCLAGYVALDTGRMCSDGQRQFSQELKEWKPLRIA